MKVLVTGARGQVGTELIQLGKKFDLQMLATDREDLDITNHKEIEDYMSSMLLHSRRSIRQNKKRSLLFRSTEMDLQILPYHVRNIEYRYCTYRPIMSLMG